MNKLPMDTWGSRVTISRFYHRDLIVFRDIQDRTGIKTLNRQVGNIIADLRKAGESDLEAEIKTSIAQYNETLDQENGRAYDKRGWEIDAVTGAHVDPADYWESMRQY